MWTSVGWEPLRTELEKFNLSNETRPLKLIPFIAFPCIDCASRGLGNIEGPCYDQKFEHSISTLYAGSVGRNWDG